MGQEEIKLLPPGKREERRVSPAVIIGIGAGAAIATGVALYFITRAKVAPPPGAATLCGIVTDDETGEPIPDVLVTLNGGSTYTDSMGAYTFADIASGEYVLKFSKSGYETATSDIVLVEGDHEFNIQMWPLGVPPPGEGIIWGFVTDNLTGEAVPDVKITLDGLVRYTEWAGQYEFRHLDYRQYQIQFSKEGYETVTRYATPDTQLNVTLPPIVPTKPELVYAEPAEAQVVSGGTLYINYKVGIPDITTGYILIFLFPLEGVRCWTPYGCANVNFRAGATAGYYEGSAPMYVKYMTDHFKFANIPRGTYRLLSTCELYRDGTLVKTYWRNVDTGQVITVV